jgi:hypothetical protein
VRFCSSGVTALLHKFSLCRERVSPRSVQTQLVCKARQSLSIAMLRSAMRRGRDLTFLMQPVQRLLRGYLAAEIVAARLQGPRWGPSARSPSGSRARR